MAGDLVASATQVHDQAREVLRFWLEETPADKRFAKDAALDAEIADRFGAWRDAVLASGAKGWTDDPVDLLGAIVLLDQFSRNIHRDSPKAFEADHLALRLAKLAISRAWDASMSDDEQQFLFMPFMHAEAIEDQTISEIAFGRVASGKWSDYAHEHAKVIERFGRFPSRNAALGRASTPEEVEYLSQPGAGW